MNKIVLVGCGNVGMAYSYALVNQKVYVDELVLIDVNSEKAEGEAMDLNHCMAYSPSKIKIKVGNYDECRDAKIVVIAAGNRVTDKSVAYNMPRALANRLCHFEITLCNLIQTLQYKNSQGTPNFPLLQTTRGQ